MGSSKFDWTTLLFLLQLGFDSLFFARIDYQDRAKRLREKTLEVIWQGSKSLGSSSQVKAHIMVLLFAFLAGFVSLLLHVTCRYSPVYSQDIMTLLMVSHLK